MALKSTESQSFYMYFVNCTSSCDAVLQNFDALTNQMKTLKTAFTTLTDLVSRNVSKHYNSAIALIY